MALYVMAARGKILRDSRSCGNTVVTCAALVIDDLLAGRDRYAIELTEETASDLLCEIESKQGSPNNDLEILKKASLRICRWGSELYEKRIMR